MARRRKVDAVNPGWPVAAQQCGGRGRAASGGETSACARGYGTGVSHLNVNRDAIHPETKRWYQGPNLAGESDKTIAVMSFATPDGKPIALFVNYAMHPISSICGALSAPISPARPHATSRASTGDVVAVWSQGAQGDQNPSVSRGASGVLSAARREGGTPAIQAEAGLDRVDQGHGRRAWRRDHPCDECHDAPERAGSYLGWAEDGHVPGRTRLDNEREGVAGRYEDGPPVNVRVGILTIGATAIGSVNAEIYTGIGQRIKASLHWPTRS